MKEMNASELKELIDSGKDIFLLDVREKEEIDIGLIDGYTMIPLDQVENNLDKIPKDKQVVVYCMSGGRSAHITEFLESKGYDNVFNLSGGIMSWIG